MRILIVDFWSDGNIGDAIMQVEMLRQAETTDAEIHVVSCFGRNQFQGNAFVESARIKNAYWYPAFFDTYVSLDWVYESPRYGRIYRLLLTLIALVVCDIRIRLYEKFRSPYLLGRFRSLSGEKFDCIIYNGRNYRNFGGRLKNYINNTPLILHQKLFNAMFPNIPKLNAGYSIWEMDVTTKNFAKKAWKNYINVARESCTYRYSKGELGLNVQSKKDLSFPFLHFHACPSESDKSAVGFSLTNTSNSDLYLDQMNEILGFFSEQRRDIFLIDQVYLPQEATLELESKIECNFKKISSPYIEEVLHFYKSCEFVVSTRMHGSIMALSQGCKVASLAYDKGAKWSVILDEIPDYPIFDPGDTSPEEILKYLQSMSSKTHASILYNRLMENQENYVEKFIRNNGA